MIATPTNLGMLPDGRLRIDWSDGEKRLYTVRDLRDNCPCAHCNDARSRPKPQPLLVVLKPEETVELKILGMEPIGNYAYAIAFSDRHDTGIYTLEHLRNLGTAE
jgi:DUF971 family protein